MMRVTAVGSATSSDLIGTDFQFRAEYYSRKLYEPFARASLDIFERSKALWMRSSTACDRSESNP